MRRICSSDDNFRKRAAKLKSHLLHSGYKVLFLQEQIDRASHARREDTFTPRTRDSSKKVPLVVIYHPGLTNLLAVTRNNMPVLHASQHPQKAIPKQPMIAYC